MHFQAANVDLHAVEFAMAEVFILNFFQRSLDLSDQFTFAIAVTQLQAELFFLDGTVYRIREVSSFILYVRHGVIHFTPELIIPCFKNTPGVRQLDSTHIFFVRSLLIWLRSSGGESTQGRRFAVLPSLRVASP